MVDGYSDEDHFCQLLSKFFRSYACFLNVCDAATVNTVHFPGGRHQVAIFLQ